MGNVLHGVQKEVEVQRVSNDIREQLYFEPGTKLKIKEKVDKTIIVYEAVVIANYPYFLNVRVDTENRGSYIKSINKLDVLTNDRGRTLIKEVIHA